MKHETEPVFTCMRKEHNWAYEWLKARNWNSQAWAIYALMPAYKGRHDGKHRIPNRVRRLAEAVWLDLRRGLISSDTTILDYEAIPDPTPEAQR